MWKTALLVSWSEFRRKRDETGEDDSPCENQPDSHLSYGLQEQADPQEHLFQDDFDEHSDPREIFDQDDVDKLEAFESVSP